MLSLLSLLYSVTSYEPTCATRAEPSVWFVMTAPPKAQQLTVDYTCQGLFFGPADCPSTVGLGKIAATGIDDRGYSTYELRYLPYGETSSILGFFQKPGGGVLYTPPVQVGDTPASLPPPLNPSELLGAYLLKRNKASAAAQGVTLHIWTCPDAKFTVPEASITPYGMIPQTHTARAPLVDPPK